MVTLNKIAIDPADIEPDDTDYEAKLADVVTRLTKKTKDRDWRIDLSNVAGLKHYFLKRSQTTRGDHSGVTIDSESATNDADLIAYRFAAALDAPPAQIGWADTISTMDASKLVAHTITSNRINTAQPISFRNAAINIVQRPTTTPTAVPAKVKPIW